eukprot:COSAG01_NODE_686_length_14245_cov_95.096140_8_plen_258_part_00
MLGSQPAVAASVKPHGKTQQHKSDGSSHSTGERPRSSAWYTDAAKRVLESDSESDEEPSTDENVVSPQPPPPQQQQQQQQQQGGKGLARGVPTSPLAKTSSNGRRPQTPPLDDDEKDTGSFSKASAPASLKTNLASVESIIVDVTVPDGLLDGELLLVELDDERQVHVEVPAGLDAGDVFEVEVTDNATTDSHASSGPLESEDEEEAAEEEQDDTAEVPAFATQRREGRPEGGAAGALDGRQQAMLARASTPPRRRR